MRIAVITNQFPSLSETFLLNHIKGFLDAGHDVEVLARDILDPENVHSDVHDYDLMKRAYCWGAPQGSATSVKKMKAAFDVFKKNPYLFGRSLKAAHLFAQAFHLNIFFPVRCFLNRPPYDIIFCHYGFNANIMLSLKDLGSIEGKMITVFHGKDIYRGLEKGAKSYRNLFEESDKIISLSQYNYENLIHFGASTQKVVHIPMGIDVDKFRTIRPFRPHQGPHYFLTVARLVEDKSLDVAIAAMAQFKKRNPRMTFKYLIIGEGPLREQLLKQVKDLGLTQEVFLLGPLEQNRIIEHLSKADVFILPSVREDLPLSLMEAQASALPVIATNVGSIRDIVIHEESGFLIEPNNILALVEKIEYCMDHPQQTHEMGRFGQKIMEQRFDVHILNYQLNELFKNIHEEYSDEAESNIYKQLSFKLNCFLEKIYRSYAVSRDANRLQNHIGAIESMESLLKENTERLRPFYEAFKENFTVDWMTISLELAAFLLTLCQVTQPKKLADLGSGFGSFVFRLYASEQEGVTVFSVDDDALWVSQTQDFLMKYGLSTDHIMIWEGFKFQDPGQFDLILHDLGPIQTREETLPFALSQLKPGGFCLVDDMHKKEYSEKAKKIIQDADADFFILSKYTLDKYKRYSALVVRSAHNAQAIR